MEEEKQTQIEELRRTVEELRESLSRATEMLSRLEEDRDKDSPSDEYSSPSAPSFSPQSDVRVSSSSGEKVIEGIFDGKDMVGNDGKRYTVPANYASKSKLVEGDTLKLTILDDGSFVYKQIGPIERKRMRGTLMHDEDSGEYSAMVEGGLSFKLLKASVTYYHGEEGDEVILLVPETGASRWAAVENIIKSLE